MNRQWTARMRVTYGVNVTVEAESRDEAIAKFKAGDWFHEQTDDVIDWSDPTDVSDDG